MFYEHASSKEQTSDPHARKPSHSPFFFANLITACACLPSAPMLPQNSLIICKKDDTIYQLLVFGQPVQSGDVLASHGARLTFTCT
jgi:hypothetical protein